MADAELNREFNATYREYVCGLEVEVVKLRREVVDLNAKLEICRQKYGKNCCEVKVKLPDWRTLLRKSGDSKDLKFRQQIYKAACKANNMSCRPRRHGLCYVARNDPALAKEPEVLDTNAGFQEGKGFDFCRLFDEYPDITLKIAKYTMVKENCISIIARFDVHDNYPPTQGGLDRKSGLSYRFHWGSSACAINSSPLPSNVLAPIYVNRSWHCIFLTTFYALNTFSFESLGEFGMFCNKTPTARLQRIRYMQIAWIGSIMERNPNPKNRYGKSRWALQKIKDFVRLESLEIFLDETSNERVRRKYEPEWVQRPLIISTKHHDNCRQYRDLRKLRGTDYIYQLRGLRHVEVFDNNSDQPRSRVWDQSFVEDMRRQVYLPKSKENIENAKVENLKPLSIRDDYPEWEITEQIQRIVRKIFETPIDPLPCDSHGESDSDNEGGFDDDNHDAESDNENNNQMPGDNDSDNEDGFDDNIEMNRFQRPSSIEVDNSVVECIGPVARPAETSALANEDSILPSIEVDENTGESHAKNETDLEHVADIENEAGTTNSHVIEQQPREHGSIKVENLVNDPSACVQQVLALGTHQEYPSLFVTQSPSRRCQSPGSDARGSWRPSSSRKRSFDDAEIGSVISTRSWEELVGTGWDFSAIDEEPSSKRQRTASVADEEVKKERAEML